MELWADESIQSIMDTKQKNTRAYDKIKVRLAAAGFIRTAAQINAKIKHLHRLYHKANDAVQRSGVSADTDEGLCPQFASSDAFLGTKPTTCPLPEIKFIRSNFFCVNTARLYRIGKSDTLPDMVIRHKYV